MVELGSLGGEVTDNIAQAGAVGKLCRRLGEKLRPTGHLARFTPRMVLISEDFVFMSRNQFEQLSEHGIMMNQGMIPFCLINDLS
jgi:hypothetical protein